MKQKEYHDRGNIKWDSGFFVSEHMAAMMKENSERKVMWLAKEIMDATEIDRILHEAKIKNKSVAIQKEEVDEEGLYTPDIIGKIVGFDELEIFIGEQKVVYDEIRNIDFYAAGLKWFDLS